MGVLFVEGEAGEGGVGRAAVCADERLLVVVHSHVALQRRLSAKLLFAFGTFELVAVFGFDVLLVLGVALAHFLAEFTFNRLSGVEGQVFSQVPYVLVRSLAEVTLERFFFSVNFFVLHQIRIFGECPATYVTLAFLFKLF